MKLLKVYLGTCVKINRGETHSGPFCFTVGDISSLLKETKSSFVKTEMRLRNFSLTLSQPAAVWLQEFSQKGWEAITDSEPPPPSHPDPCLQPPPTHIPIIRAPSWWEAGGPASCRAPPAVQLMHTGSRSACP